MTQVGNPAPIEQGFHVTWDRLSGRKVTRTFEGSPVAIAYLEDPARNSGATDVQLSQQAGSAKATLTASYGDPLQVEITRIIRFNDVTFPIHQNPTYIGISTARIKAVNDESEKSSPDTSGFTATELSYYNLIARGVKDYRVKLPIVTYTRVVPFNSPETISTGTPGTVYTPAQVSNAVGDAILFSIPTGNVGVTANSDFTAGYLFDVEVDLLANGNWQLIETFEYGLWANNLYVFA